MTAVSRSRRGRWRLAGALAMLAGCAREPTRPNLVLISIDTLRADHLGTYGYARDTSPAIDALAREGVVFERTYSTSNWTLPAHVSMLTGLYPAEHGVHRMTQAIPAGVELLPEALGRLGYASAAVVSTVPFLTGRHGFDRGWRIYDAERAYPPPGTPAERFVASELVHRRALELLDRLGAGPFFLFVHDFDVHTDYRPPPPFDRRFRPEAGGEARPGLRRARVEAALYDGEIRWVDSWIGRLLDELRRRDLLERTLVLLTADHGEEFLEHGDRYHGRNLFDTSIRVPLVARFPGGAHAGTRIVTPVSLVDVGATLLAAAGRGRPEWRSGRDLAGLLGGRSAGDWPAREIFVTGKGRRGHLTAIVDGGRKLVARADATGRPIDPRPRIVALDADGREGSARRPDRHEAVRLRERLLATWRRQSGGRPPLPEIAPASDADAAALRALGYL